MDRHEHTEHEDGEPLGHSEHYMGPYRDFWWNRDFVELMARRLSLASYDRILDIGCGTGHWLRTLLPFLSEEAWIIAADRDPKWSAKDAAWAEDLRSYGISLELQQADLEKLPFEDATFDMVTCQTVLIHMRDPRHALTEMLRVLRPGGLLLCAEPDNFGTYCAASTQSLTRSLEEEAQAFLFELAQQRGRTALGLGNVSLGGILPGIFAEAGLKNIQVHLSDKACPLFPPYETEEQRVMLAETENWFSSAPDASVEQVRRFYIAGGGNPADFEAHWAREQERRRAYLETVQQGRLNCAGGTLMYLLSANKA